MSLEGGRQKLGKEQTTLQLTQSTQSCLSIVTGKQFGKIPQCSLTDFQIVQKNALLPVFRNHRHMCVTPPQVKLKILVRFGHLVQTIDNRVKFTGNVHQL